MKRSGALEVYTTKASTELRRDFRGKIMMMTLESLIFAYILPLAHHTFLGSGWDKYYYSHFTDEETQYRQTETPLSQAELCASPMPVICFLVFF